MKDLKKNVFKTENINDETYNEILQSISSNYHLEKLLPQSIISLTQYYNSLISISNLSEEEILEMPGVGRTKLNKIQEFQNKIKEDKDYFITYYCLEEATIKLPFNYNAKQDVLISFSELMRDLALIYDLRADKKSKRNAELIKLYFGVNGTFFGREEISKILNISKQRVNQIITRPNESVIMQLFSNNNPTDRIMVEPDFYDKVLEIKRNSLWNNKFIDYISSYKNIDIQFATLFAEVFQCYLTEIEENYFLVESSNTIFFKEHYRALKQTLNEQIEPLTLDEVCDLVLNEIANVSLNKDFIKKILEQDFYEKIITDENGTKYQIHWELLTSLNSKVKRILFEARKPLSKKEILFEYNKRQSNLGLGLIESENLIIRSDVNLISLGNNNWKYSTTENNINLQTKLNFSG